MSTETPTSETPNNQTPASDPAPEAATPANPEVAQKVSEAIARGEAAAAAVAAEQAAPKPKEKKPSEPKPKPAPAPTAAEIEADIAAARERLTSTLVQLEDAVTPASFARRAKTTVKGVYVDEFGGIKVKNVAITAGVVVGAIVLVKIIK